jgi:hypothetical protein
VIVRMSKFNVRLTRREAVVITVFFLLTWFVGYVTGAEVTRIWEKSAVIHDCIFVPAPENSSPNLK